ncbi:ferritin-like domain-containing protein [Methylobacterium sp. J-076]|uniref:ferritin-like domain-containing protein n=1 Tax=Methylobacterium sp. J-076 TaxID=2836655 RepID=UPI001FBB660D|nr:ferritin-like domain-containing protein [Methylobacterium sp. J-076]MCJ2011919.1 ferritin-like domain-containing protein [Methylobacterium sp. J-076]
MEGTLAAAGQNVVPVHAEPDEAGRQAEQGRRSFLRAAGLGAIGVSALASQVAPAQAQSVSDIDIFNFALNLEYLEAEFYRRAAFGVGLEASDVDGTGTPGSVSGGRQVPFADPNIRKIAVELANDELAHVRTLRTALGGNRVSRPAIDLSLAFTFAARAAGLVGPNDTFDAFGNDANFLLAAYIFEDVGVSAYLGGGPLISDPRNLSGAARILAVEGYHAGAIRTQLYVNGFYNEAQAITNARNTLNPNTNLDQGIGDANTANIVLTDPATGVTPARTPQQVLNIVYLNSNTRPTGFFPNGLNGTIR